MFIHTGEEELLILLRECSRILSCPIYMSEHGCIAEQVYLKNTATRQRREVSSDPFHGVSFVYCVRRDSQQKNATRKDEFKKFGSYNCAQSEVCPPPVNERIHRYTTIDIVSKLLPFHINLKGVV
jgi:hypothetical protein